MHRARRRQRRIAAGQRVVIRHPGAGDFDSRPGLRRRHLDLDQGKFLLAAIQLIERQLRLLTPDHALAPDKAERPHIIGKLDLHHQPAGDDIEHIAEFGGEDVGQILARFDEIRVAIAALRQARHEILVVAKPQPHGRDGDAFLQERRTEPPEFLGRIGTDVGEPIRQQHDAIHAVIAFAIPAQLRSPLRDAGKERRVPAGLDGFDRAFDVAAVADRLGRDQRPHVAGIGDEREDIVR